MLLKNIRYVAASVTVLAFIFAATSMAIADGNDKTKGHHKMADESPARSPHQPLTTTVEIYIPKMDPVAGKKLFIEKACIICHAINGIGGTDGPQIDAHVMMQKMNAFEFGARMWNHSQGMVAVQIAALGEHVKLSGNELAHITAFVHDDVVQHSVKEADIPHNIREKFHHEHGAKNGHAK